MMCIVSRLGFLISRSKGAFRRFWTRLTSSGRAGGRNSSDWLLLSRWRSLIASGRPVPGSPYRSLRLSYEASPSSPKMWLSQVSP